MKELPSRQDQHHRDIGSGLTVYPNPFTEDELQVEFATEWQQDGLLRIYDQFGRIVFRQQLPADAIDRILQIDLRSRHLVAGLYLLEISTDDGSREMKKILKQN